MPPWRQHGEDLLLAVRVQPRATRNAIIFSGGDTLQIRVTPPAVEEAANEAVRLLLAKALAVPKSRISILHGRHARDKLIRIQGLSPGEATRRLGVS